MNIHSELGQHLAMLIVLFAAMLFAMMPVASAAVLKIDTAAFDLALSALMAAFPPTTNVSNFDYRSVESSIRVQHRYVIRLRDDLPVQVVDGVSKLLQLLQGIVLQRFQRSFHGFTIDMNGQLPLPLDALRRIPWIRDIEEDFKVSAQQVQPLDRAVQWGLDRLDQKVGPLDNSYTFDLTGKGVNVYFFDSGIDASHPEFTGRAKTVYVAASIPDQIGTDCTGHGTHIAGLIGGVNTGVAKRAILNSLRIIGCDNQSSNSEILGALEWVITNAQLPAVISMSLGSQLENGVYKRAPILDQTIGQVINAGIPVFVAAGNDNRDCCSGTPSGTAGVMTVGASSTSDTRASFSNYGSCVSIFAPGESIVSSAPGGGYAMKKGTSQATPFVAGVAALFLERNPSAKPDQVYAALKAAAVPIVQDSMGSSNLLLQSVSVPIKNSVEANSQLVNLLPFGTVRLDQKTVVGLSRSDTNYIIMGAGILVCILVAGIIYRQVARRQRMAKKPDANMGDNGRSDVAATAQVREESESDPLPTLSRIPRRRQTEPTIHPDASNDTIMPRQSLLLPYDTVDVVPSPLTHKQRHSMTHMSGMSPMFTPVVLPSTAAAMPERLSMHPARSSMAALYTPNMMTMTVPDPIYPPTPLQVSRPMSAYPHSMMSPGMYQPMQEAILTSDGQAMAITSVATYDFHPVLYDRRALQGEYIQPHTPLVTPDGQSFVYPAQVETFEMPAPPVTAAAFPMHHHPHLMMDSVMMGPYSVQSPMADYRHMECPASPSVFNNIPEPIWGTTQPSDEQKDQRV